MTTIRRRRPGRRPPLRGLSFLRAAAVAALALLGGTATAPTVGASQYQLPRDFGHANTVGPWSFGSTAAETGNFSPFTTPPVFRNLVYHMRSGNVLIGATADQPVVGSVFFKTRLLAMHPDQTRDAAVRFKVPATGTYRISVRFSLLDRVPSGVRVNVFLDGKDASARVFGPKNRNLTQPGATDQTVGATISSTLDIGLKAGSVMDFTVNPLGDIRSDTVGLSLNIVQLR